MKTKNLIKATILTLVLTTSVTATHVYAGSKQKPPVVVTDQAIVWYAAVLDFFGIS
ncbi:hypothetical protein [Aliiglaciecola lipolytica]|uniref:Uncharacterized protein n=1 Tax=Aliiglaciecola lipolytica E3 TaxID=1127673 RepID=K6YBM9_9ALTE|nr:hypothetical protein [Aliiglaciecola lipolytica]GAC14053.1 hypothetical protein GLIP_1417 [Aliiglaciecola lipolytica E3]